MAKKILEDEKPQIIPQNEYKEELEKQVAYHLSTAIQPTFVSKKRYTPEKYPEKFRDKREETEYQIEMINRLRNGYDGLSAKGWGFINFAKIRNPEKGKISPTFMVCQEDYFRKVEALQANPGRGLVGYKRRRVGYSTIGSWDVWHDCATKPFYQIGMNSFKEDKSRELFKHVKFIHQNVPGWLRPTATSTDRRDYMEFSWNDKDENGNRIKKGNQSWILSTSGEPNSHEGAAYSKLFIDEAGKQEHLLELWQYSEDCLRINTRRVGVPIIAGTVGNIDKDGKGLLEMYKNSDAYKLDKFCFHGYNGLLIDEFGNDLIEESIRWIIYEREQLKSAKRSYLETHYQKYPLNEKEAFNQVSSGGVGNIILINDQITRLYQKPPEVRQGWMRPSPDGGVDFVPNPNGKILVYEMPDHTRKNAYVAGADPADSDDKKKKAGKDVSDLALAIVAKPFGVQAPKLVLEYVDRPEKLDSFFEQSAMALRWYNNTKVLVEDNRARMINYFKAHYPHLLPLVPVSILTAKTGFEMKNSITMTEARKQQIMGLAEDNIDNYSQYIPSIKLLEQHKVFGDLHADDDLAMAFFLALVMLQADKRPAGTADPKPPTSHRYEHVQGMIKLVTTGSSAGIRKVPKHPLFG